MKFNLDDFNYHLPEELIAQEPAARRDEARLMVLDRASKSIEHSRFAELGRWMAGNALMVINDARVVPVRLEGRKKSGGRIEVTLLEPPFPEDAPGEYEIECLVKPTKRIKPGLNIRFGNGLDAEVKEITAAGRTIMRFRFHEAPVPTLENLGRMPLPPYIKRSSDAADSAGLRELDRQRYQTIYARSSGAVAAPTAGLHFTEDLFSGLKSKGVDFASLTLLVGYGTFAPVQEKDIERHRMHAEKIVLPESCVQAVNQAKTDGREVTAVGTTSVRALEYGAQSNGLLRPYEGWCDLFIYPGFEFKVVDHLVTNFHLPRSTLLMLAAAFAGLDTILEAYRVAVAEKYRFYSYGDAMLIL